jgi:hypothetical protein
MDWFGIAKLIAPLAPALGGVLGGFIPVPGGALAGQALGNVIARSLGVPATPEAVAGAVVTMEERVLIAKLNAATEEARAKWPAFAEAEKAYYDAQARVAETVNATIRAELSAENRHWFYTGWRPAAGWVFDFFAVAFGSILTWASLLAVWGNAVPLRLLTEAWPLFAAYLGILAAMVGVYVIGRSQEKAKVIETATPAKPTTR